MSVVLFLCLCYVGSSQSSTSSNYWLVNSITYDGEKLPIGNGELFLVDSLVFEGLYTLVDSRISKLQPDGKFVVNASTKDSLTKYVVSDLKAERCFVFSLNKPPKLIQTAPLSAKEKITGILFKDEAYPVLGNNAKNFQHIADTVIGDFKYHILENTVAFTIQNIKYRKARVYLNTDLQKFPFHPISTQMDRLFEGAVTRMELYGNDNKAFVIDYRIDTIPKDKLAFISRYLKLAMER